MVFFSHVSCTFLNIHKQKWYQMDPGTKSNQMRVRGRVSFGVLDLKKLVELLYSECVFTAAEDEQCGRTG